jgi:FAD synthetase
MAYPSALAVGALSAKIAASAKIISTALDNFSSGLGVCVSGGKDAAVMLDLAVRTHARQNYSFPLSFYYFQLPSAFPEVTQTVKDFENYWNISIRRIQTDSLKTGLGIGIRDFGLKAVMLGLRRTDPTRVSDAFEWTTEGWPKAMRVHPILEWSFRDIWDYTDLVGLPVCELYGKGFTSIGESSGTHPNPLLQDRHARELTDVRAERLGRT